jgi:hypothetical protein
LSLAQSALAGLLVVLDRLTAAMSRADGIEALGVESCDEARDRVSGAPADRVGGGLRVGSVGHSEKEGGPRDFGSRSGLGAAETFQNALFVAGQRKQGIFFPAGHVASCRLPGERSQPKG